MLAQIEKWASKHCALCGVLAFIIFQVCPQEHVSTLPVWPFPSGSTFVTKKIIKHPHISPPVCPFSYSKSPWSKLLMCMRRGKVSPMWHCIIQTIVIQGGGESVAVTDRSWHGWRANKWACSFSSPPATLIWVDGGQHGEWKTKKKQKKKKTLSPQGLALAGLGHWDLFVVKSHWSFIHSF